MTSCLEVSLVLGWPVGNQEVYSLCASGHLAPLSCSCFYGRQMHVVVVRMGQFLTCRIYNCSAKKPADNAAKCKTCLTSPTISGAGTRKMIAASKPRYSNLGSPTAYVVTARLRSRLAGISRSSTCYPLQGAQYACQTYVFRVSRKRSISQSIGGVAHCDRIEFGR